MDELFDELSRVPDLVVPITALGIVGHVLMLLLGFAVLVAGSLAATRSGSLFLTLFLTGPGVYFLVLAQHRFLRAVHPDSTLVNITLWVAFLGLAIAGGVLFVWLLDDIGAGLVFTIGAVVAAAIARLLDGIHEKMHGVPMSWGIVVVGAVIVVGLVLEGRSRR